jgi:MFS family permease
MRLPAPHGQLLSSIYLPSLLMAISNQGMLLVLPLYALHISGDPAYAALVVALRGIGILLLDIPAGMLAARFGDKNVLVGGLACNALVMISLAIWTDPLAVAVLATLQGGGAAAWFLGRQSYLTDASPVSMWGRAIAVVAGINRGGAFLGPLAGGIVAEWLGYGAAFLAGGLLSVLAAAISSVFARRLRPDREPDAAGLAVIGQVIAEHRGVFATAGFVGLAIQLMRAGRQLLVPLFGTLIGLDAATIGFVYSMSAVLDMSLSYPAGMAMDRLGRRWTGIPCMVVFIAGLVLLPLADGFSGLVAAALVLGFANGISTGIVMVMGMDLAPADNRNHFLGVWRLIGDVGGVGGPLVTGALASAASLAVASFTVAGIGVFGLLVFLSVVPETQRSDRDEDVAG